MTGDSWSDLQSLWQREPTGAAPVVAQVRRVERTRLWSRLVRVALAGLGITGLIAAVAHSVTTMEAAAAFVVAATIAVYFAWSTRDEARHYDMLGRDSSSYLRGRQAQLRTELRAITYTWVVIGAELAFFVPWLSDGIPIHFGSFWSLPALLAWWLPISGIGMLLAATIRAAVRKQRELRQISEMVLQEDSAP